MVRVKPEEFVRIWQTSASMDEVLVALPDMDYYAICQRASRYRRAGVPLKSMPRKRANKWDALKQLAWELADANT